MMILGFSLQGVASLLLEFFLSLRENILKVSWQWWLCTHTFLIICFVAACIRNPEGAINLFMIKLIDIISVPFPSTPSQYKLGTILTAFFNTYDNIGYDTLFEIFQGIFGMLAIYLGVKLYKMLPFT
jgi:hypothetical protein